MTSTSHSGCNDQDGTVDLCWCCGCSGNVEQMAHLGQHPEVAVCIRCAHSLSKWAWEIEDRSKTGPAAKTRHALRAARNAVVQRGWQNSPVLGGPIKWIGRRLP
jgi:uncharacterized paraquat-inducible protein A